MQSGLLIAQNTARGGTFCVVVRRFMKKTVRCGKTRMQLSANDRQLLSTDAFCAIMKQ